MTEPSSLHDLIAWYRDVVGDRIPQRLHNRDTDSGGAPDWTSQFKRYLTAHPAQLDKEGYVTDPLAYWLWKMRRSGGKDARRAEFLWLLAWCDMDPLAATRFRADTRGYLSDMADAWAEKSLRILWRQMQREPVIYVKGKSESQINAEAAG